MAIKEERAKRELNTKLTKSAGTVINFSRANDKLKEELEQSKTDLKTAMTRVNTLSRKPEKKPREIVIIDDDDEPMSSAASQRAPREREQKEGKASGNFDTELLKLGKLDDRALIKKYKKTLSRGDEFDSSTSRKAMIKSIIGPKFDHRFPSNRRIPTKQLGSGAGVGRITK